MKYKIQHTIIRERPREDKPRERLISFGPKAISDKELITMLIGSGSKDNPVDTLASAILKLIDAKGTAVTVEMLMDIHGLGPAKASVIAAALELGRRCNPGPRKRISHPGEVYPVIRHFADRMQEHFICISLNGAHEVLAVRVVSIGLVNRTIVHPREVFSDPLRERATAVIVAHNHPSGSLVPSREDLALTTRLRESGILLGISLLDHLVFSQESYYSFLEHGEL